MVFFFSHFEQGTSEYIKARPLFLLFVLSLPKDHLLAPVQKSNCNSIKE